MDSLPITARSFEEDYHIDGDGFERAYKDHLSGYREWPELEHADQWLLYPENIGPHVSIDETCLSTGEVYTIVTNKAAHGRKGCIIAVVRGTKAKVVTEALKRMPESLRMSVEEVTLDFSESMHEIVEACFPCAMRTLDRFHHQQFCLEALQEVRIEHRREQMTREPMPGKNTGKGCADSQRVTGRLLMHTEILSGVMPDIPPKDWRTVRHGPNCLHEAKGS